MQTFLTSPLWQGISAIVGIIGIGISLWQVRQSQTNRTTNTVDQSRRSDTTQRLLLSLFSLLLPVYAIFVGSILLVNTFVKDPNQITYGSVFMATIVALFWGIVWANYIQKAFKPPVTRSSNNKSKQNGA